MISERQKELACWFDDWQKDNGVLINVPIGFDENNETIGPWLDADWCFKFIHGMRREDKTIIFDIISMEKMAEMMVSVNVQGGHEYFNAGTLTERIQEVVKFIISRLPKESKQIIKEMK